MANVTYDFDTQFERGKRGETFLDAYFRQWYTVIPVTAKEQRQGIDRWFEPYPFGPRFTVEYKTDRTAARTHNAFIETISVDTTHKPGWIYTSQAAYLVYYIPGSGNEIIYILPFVVIREQLPRWIKRYPERTIPNVGYCTHGLLVELYEFEQFAVAKFSV